LSEYIANIVTGKDKQDAALLIVAPKGYGKSYSALQLAYEIAHEIAAIIDKDREQWRKYFPIDEEKGLLTNVAIVNIRDVLALLKDTQPYNVYVLDDMGVAINARNFMKEENIVVNDIFELIRIENTVFIITVMDQAFIDKVPRQIVTFFSEIVEKHHDMGFNVMKVHLNRKHFRKGKMFYPYIQSSSGRIIRHVIGSPPEFISRIYDRMRLQKTREDRDRKIEKIMDRTDIKKERHSMNCVCGYSWERKKEDSKYCPSCHGTHISSSS